MKQRIALIATTAAACAGLTLTAAPGHAGAASTHHTTFAFGGSGYGTRVTGGKLPVSSDTTGYQVVGCTDRAGLRRTNDVADATVPGLGTVSGVRTRVWTTQRHGVTTSHSTHRIADLTIASGGLGSLRLEAITSHSRAFHDARGFHTATSTGIGAHQVHPADGRGPVVPRTDPGPPDRDPGPRHHLGGTAPRGPRRAQRLGGRLRDPDRGDPDRDVGQGRPHPRRAARRPDVRRVPRSLERDPGRARAHDRRPQRTQPADRDALPGHLRSGAPEVDRRSRRRWSAGRPRPDLRGERPADHARRARLREGSGRPDRPRSRPARRRRHRR